MLKSRLFLMIITILFILSCSRGVETSKRSDNPSTILALDLSDENIDLAKSLGLELNLGVVSKISGPQHLIDKLKLKQSLPDSTIELIAPKSVKSKKNLRDNQKENDKSSSAHIHYYLAKEDFNIPKLQELHPTYDGRGVIVGGIDDGVSPTLPGMKVTTEGKRKFLKRTSQSKFYMFELAEVQDDGSEEEKSDFTRSYKDSFSKVFEGICDAELKKLITGDQIDLNGNGSFEKISLSLFENDKKIKLCVDVNVNSKIDEGECLRPFSESGDYTFWNKKTLRELTFEFNQDDKVVILSEGEVRSDSHGEGVASVMTGHKIAGRFDGVAPGSQYLDYDLSQNSEKFDQSSVYTLGTFIKSLEWMGENGAEVVNISYSIFFYNAASQLFMQKALEKLVEKYNFVLTFSAGNNGPGLGSHNRGVIYPEDSLVAGAFLNRQLDEYVHGVTGIPEEGSVVYYSSIGPGIHNGAGPTVISPLSSLTYSSGIDGFRAFNGTSSAAPALAGAAAVLISAVKQEKMMVDAGSIVHALRLSCVPLKDTPFVNQGAGLPKVDQALEIYREIIAGKSFKNVHVEVVKKQRTELTHKGYLFRTSEKKGIIDGEIRLTGKLSSLAPFDSSQNTLETLEVTYSHDFIKGPSKLWLSTGPSRLYISIDLENIKSSDSEIFGEIKLISNKTKKVLQTIPVTIINDRVLDKSIIVEGELASQSGHRLHLKIPRTVKGVGVRILRGTRFARTVFGSLYNSSNVIMKRFSPLSVGNTFFLDTKGNEFVQLTLVRFGGTENKNLYRYEVFPIDLELKTDFLDSSDMKLSISNYINDLETQVSLKKSDIKKTKTFFKFDEEDNSSLDLGYEITVPGRYIFEYEVEPRTSKHYFYMSCLQKYEIDGVVSKLFSPRTIEFTEDNLPLTVHFKCFPFDFNGESFFNNIKVFAFIKKLEGDGEYKPKLFKKGPNTLDFSSTENLEKGAFYDVYIKPLFAPSSSDTIKIGTLEAL